MKWVFVANRAARNMLLWIAAISTGPRDSSIAYAAEPPASPSIAAMRAAYMGQLGSIHTLSATYRIVDSPPPREDRDETPRERFTDRYLYHRDGGKFYLGQRTAPLGLVTSAQIWDGKRFCGVMRQDVSTPKESVTVQEFGALPPLVLCNFRPEHLVGAELYNAKVTLHEALARPTARLIGPVKSVSGDPCWRIALGAVLSQDKSCSMELVVDLDTRHDFLPARIELTEGKKEGAAATPTGWRNEWQINQFSQVRDEATGKMRWFPQKARLIQMKGALSLAFVIERIAINAKIPDSTFDPLMAPIAPLGEDKPPSK
jgi:hypothetical protein